MTGLATYLLQNYSAKNRYFYIGFFESNDRLSFNVIYNVWVRPLTDQELHNLAMNIVGKQLEAEGYEFLGVNSKPKKNPQFVCIKEKQLHFIVVRSFRYPDDPKIFDQALMAKVKKHAVGFEAQSHFAGVGLVNAADEKLPVFLNEAYVVNYEGLVNV